MTNPIPLPPLPAIRDWPHSHEELRARDLEVARLVLEAAAKVCSDYAIKAMFDGDPESDHEGAAIYLQDAIRALEVSHG